MRDREQVRSAMGRENLHLMSHRERAIEQEAWRIEGDSTRDYKEREKGRKAGETLEKKI